MHERQPDQDNSTEILNKALQQIKGSKCMKQCLEELYTPIVKQYYNIKSDGDFCDDAILKTVWRDFPKLLMNSLRLVAGNRRLRLVTKTLNSVAEIWDKDVRKSPTERSHLFFFCSADVEADDDASNTIYTRMFYDFAPPDHRLICIFLPVGAKYTQLDFYETLHEAGHFIGRRIRKDRIELFRKAVVAEFCNQVYLHTMREALHEPTHQNIHPNIEEDVYYAKQLRKLSFSARKSVMKLFRDLEISSVEYTNALNRMKQDITAGYQKENYRERAENALANGYFSFATPVVLSALQSKLSTQKDDVAESIKAAFEKVFAELDECLSNPEALIPLWVKVCERQYQEPAADLFMIRITKMNAQKYIRFALTTTYNCWAGLKKKNPGLTLTFLQYLSNDEVFPKYVGILCSVFSEDCDRIIDGSRRFKARCFPRTRNKAMKAELERGYNLIRQAIKAYQDAKPSAVDKSNEKDQEVLLTIFNPIHRVYSYMSMVQDRFWKRYPAPTSPGGSATKQSAQETEENVDPKIQNELERLIRSVVIIREHIEIK